MIDRKAAHKTRRAHAVGAVLACLPLLLGTACNVDTPTDRPSSGQTARATRTPRPPAASSFTGTLDITFGKGGKVTTDAGGGNEQAVGAIVQADGKIVVLGESWPKTKPTFTFTRYDAQGRPDTGFGDDGKLVVSVTGSEYDYSSPRALIQQPDGKFIAVGTTIDFDAGHLVFAALRYNPDGTPDEEFGTDGVVMTDFARDRDYIEALELLPDGKIVAAGPVYIDVTFCATTACASPGFGLAQYNSDGTLDESFGQDGKVGYRQGTDLNYDVVRLPDGKLLTAGSIDDNDSFALMLLNPDGTQVESFGDEGLVSTQFDDYKDYGQAMTVQPDGKVIVVGTATSDQEDMFDTDFAIARYK